MSRSSIPSKVGFGGAWGVPNTGHGGMLWAAPAGTCGPRGQTTPGHTSAAASPSPQQRSPTSQPLSLATAPFQLEKKGTFWHGTGRAAQPRCAASPPASQLFCSIPQKLSRRATPSQISKCSSTERFAPAFGRLRTTHKKGEFPEIPAGKSSPAGLVPAPAETDTKPPPARSTLKTYRQGKEGLTTRKKPSVRATDNCRDYCHFVKRAPLKTNRLVI